MHQKAKRFAVLFLTVLLIALAAQPAFAAGQVSYQGQASRFIFTPGSKHSPTDLFESFKNVMPGDSVKQTIEVRNDVSNGVKIRIYLRAVGAVEGADFLSQLSLTVAKHNDGSKMFAAAASEKADLAEWTLLGTLYSGGKEELDVTLDVPVTLGNEFQDAVGKLAWEFKIEELPTEPDDPTPPPTGDGLQAGLWGALAGAALTGAALLLIPAARKRRKAEETR